jgi:hypothetical protein
MRKIKIAIISIVAFGILLVLFAFARTWNKTDIEFRIHINEKLIQVSTFGEPPTFAIWIENPETKVTQTIFATRRAASGDWEGKAAVPAALPRWFEVFKIENQSKNVPNYEKPAPLAITGATPKPGYFKTRVRVTPGSKWNCWIEVNLSGDFNEQYKEFNEEQKMTDEFSTGQPALLYKAEIEAVKGKIIKPEIFGMSLLDPKEGNIIRPLKGITTAADIFDEISIAIIKPTPRIIEWH